jgi:uroporphyrinogen decarboxylase
VNNKFLKTFQGDIFDTPPLWFMRQAGRTLPEYREVRQKVPSFLDLCLTPELASKVTLQPIERFDLDAAILFSDILMIPYGLNQHVSFLEGEGPVLKPLDLSRLNPVYPDQFLLKLSPIFETVRLVKMKLPTSKALIGFAGGPWTVSTYMVEGKKSPHHTGVKRIAFEKPEQFDALISLLTDYTYLYLKEQIKAGVDAIQLFDSWSGALPQLYFERWVLKPLFSLLSSLKKEFPHIPVIFFPKGAGGYYSLFFKQNICPDAFSLDSNVNFQEIASAFSHQCVFQGGLDPQLVVTGGKALYSEVDRILSVFKNKPYIFNLSHGLDPETPLNHVEGLVQWIRQPRA